MFFETRKESWSEPEKSVGTWFRIRKLFINHYCRDSCWETLFVTTIAFTAQRLPERGNADNSNHQQAGRVN